ncbi:formate dehydrogenase accessory sulfurtransferase FdhD [Myxococcota bacterium]|nr:formate dehydrogenase accessory sulfurtransferase FdhD [Myxococcota bacterium]
MTRARIRQFDVTAHGPERRDARSDRVAIEEPLEIRIDGAPLAVVMRTPGDDLELAAGFLFAEEILRSSDDIGTIAHCRSGNDPDLANVVDVRLAAERRGTVEAVLAQRKAERSTVTSASCGVCGKKTIESLQASARPFPEAAVIDAALVATLPARLRAAQEVFDATGGLHASAIFSPTGELLVAREDVGRHNAVDKCVGALLLREQLPLRGPHVLMASGRTSFEIVQKALVARIQSVASVSAPSSLAIELARASNMGLAGFVRDGSLNVYAGTTR